MARKFTKKKPQTEATRRMQVPQNALTLKQAAKKLHTSVETLIDWNEQHILKPVITEKGKIYYTREQIAEFMALREPGPVAEPEAQTLPAEEPVIEPEAVPQEDIFIEQVESPESYAQPLSAEPLSHKPSFFDNFSIAFLYKKFLGWMSKEVYQDSFVAQYEDAKQQAIEDMMPKAPSGKFLSSLAVVFAILTIVAFTQESRIGFLVNQFEHNYITKDANKPQVLAAQTSSLNLTGSIILSLPLQAKQNVEVGQNLTVSGTSVFKKNITAPNVLYGIKGGSNITISNQASQTPTISVTGLLTSLQGQTGDVTLTAGTDIAINGTTISNASTLATVVSRGGCSSCVTAADVAHNLVIDASGQVAAAAVTGTLGTSVGGTGLTSYVTGDMLYASGANTLSSLPIGTASGQILQVQNGVPSWTSLSLNSSGTSSNTSGASMIGVYPQFVNSTSTNLQQVLKDLDSSITSAGVSPFTIDVDGTYGNYIRPTTAGDHFILGGTTIAGSKLFFNTTTGVLNLGTSGSLNGQLTLFSTNTATSSSLTTDATGNLLIPTGNVGVGASPTDLDADGNPFKLEVAGSIGPNQNGVYDLGSPTHQYRNLYLTGQTTSGGNITIANAAPEISFTETDNANYGFSIQTNNGTYLINNDTTGQPILSSVGTTGNIDLAGGSSSTGCTIANDTGNLTCSGTGTFGTGLTVTTGAINLTATSGAIALSGLGSSSIDTGTNGLTITSNNFNTTATGINNTAIGATTASTGSFTTLSGTSLSVSGNTTLGTSTSNTVTFNAALSGQNVLNFIGASSSGFFTTLAVVQPTQNNTINLPNASGTLAISASGPLVEDAFGNLTCPTCVVGSGGSTTSVLLAPSSNQIDATTNTSIDIAKTGVGTLLSLQDIANLATPYIGSTAAIARNFTGGTNNIGGILLSLLDTSSTTGINNPTGINLAFQTPSGSSLFTGDFLNFSRADVAGGALSSKFSIDANGNATASGTFNGATLSGGTLSGGTVSGGTLSGGTYAGSGFSVTGSYTGTIASGGNFSISNGTNNILSVTDAGGSLGGNLTNIYNASASGTITFSGLTANGPVYTTAGGVLNSEAQLAISRGGTNNSAFTTNSLTYFNGTSITSLGAATNGQLVIGSTGAAPVLASLTGTTNQVIVTNGAGSITLGTPQDIATTSAPTFNGINAFGTSGIFGWFQRNNQAISPTNSTDDFLLGGISTASARFAFTNNGGSGTPTASISANSGNNATFLTGAGVLGTTNDQTLTIGNGTTGSVVFSPNGTTALSIQNGIATVGAPGSVTGQLSFANAANTGTTIFQAGNQSGTNITYTLPTASPAVNGSVLESQTDGTLSWAVATCPTCLVQVPPNTAQNTVTPTADNTVSLTLNGTTGTGSAHILDIIPGGGGIQSYFTAAGAFTTLQAISASTSGNTINNLVFNGTGDIGGTLTSLTPSGAFTIGSQSQNLTLQGATTSLTSTNGGVTNALTFATPTTSNKTITLPNASGTVAVSASGVVALDSAGNITCPDCLTGGTGSGNLTGVILAPATAQSDTSTNNSIFINKTGLASLLNLTQGSTITANNTTADLNITRAVTSATAAITNGGSLLSLANSSNLSGAGAVNNPTEILVTNPTPTGGAIFTGNFIDLQRADSAGGAEFSKFSVSATGNVTLAGNLTATGTINGLTITNNGTNTLDIAAGKTFAVNNSLTLAGTDNTSFTFPSTTGGTVITSNAPSQTITSPQASGTVLGISDATALSGAITGQSISLSGTGAFDQTGLLITLAGANGANLNAIVVNDGTSNTATIAKSGAATFVGVNAQTGLLQGTGGLTLSGPVNINAASSSATTIGTGTGSVTLGNATGGLTLPGFTNVMGVFYANGSGVVGQTAQGGTGTVLHGNGTSAPSFSAVNLTADVGTSILPVSNGGTGVNTLALNGVVLGNGTNAVNVTAAGTAYQVLTVPAAGGAPAFGAIDLSQGAAVGTSILPIANGGTNTSGIGSAGSIAYSNSGTSYGFSGQGSAGQALLSGGTASPTWTSGTLTLAQNFALSGTSPLTLVTTATTSATLPAGTITLADLESAQTFTGAKTFTPSGTNAVTFNLDYNSPLLRNFYSATDSSSGSAYIINNSATSGTVAIVGDSYQLIGTNTSGANTVTGINFENVTAATNNTFNGITFGTGLTNFISSPTINITGTGAITGAQGVTTTNLNTTGTVNIANLSSGAGSALCSDGSFNLIYCTAGSSTATLQSAYNLGNTITTSSNRSIDFYLANSPINSMFYVEEQGTATEAAILVNDTNTSVTNNLLQLQSNGTPTFTASENGSLSLAGNNTIDITTITGGNSLTIQPADITSASGIGGDLTLGAGNATGTTSTGGNVSINAGSGTTSGGVINIGTTTSTSQINLGGTGVYTKLPALTTSNGTALCQDSITKLIVACSAGSSSATLQSAYNQGNTILTTTNRDISFTLASTSVPSSFIITNEGTATSSAVIINDTNSAINSTLLAFQSNGVQNLGIDELGNATSSGTFRTTGTGTFISANGLTVQAGGINVSGGINNNSGGITNTGAISGITTIDASGTASLSGANPLTLSNANPTLTLATAGTNGVFTIQDAEATPNTLLTLTDAGTTGNLSVTGNLNTNGYLQTNGVNRLDNNGALANITTISSGAITTTGTLTFNAALSPDITTGTNEDLTLVANGTGKINLNDTVLLADPTSLTQGATALCRNTNGEIATCVANASGVTLQQAYQAGNTINASNTYGSLALTLASGSNAQFTATNSGSATNTFVINDTDSGPTHNALNVMSNGTSNLTITELGTLTTSGNLTTTGTGTVTAAGGLTVSSGGITNNNGGITGAGAIAGATSLTASGTITFSGLSNGIVYATNSGILTTESQVTSAQGGTGADLSAAVQGSLPFFSATGIQSALAPDTAGYVLQTNGTGANPTWVNPATLGTNYWNLANGALSPKNNTNDLLLGSAATSSAVFGFINVAPGSGTPTASISAGTTGATYLTAAGLLATTNDQTLTLGNSTTGNIILAPNGTTALTTSGANITTGGTLTVPGLITGNAGLGITGGAVNLNANSNYSVGIATGTSTGAVSIGGGSNTVAISTNSWGISSTGIISGVTGYTQGSGTFTVNGGGAVSLGTGTNNVTIGNTNGGTLAIASSALNVTTLGAVSGVTTLSLSSYISGATATNTINGAIINGSTQTFSANQISDSGNLVITSTATNGSLTLKPTGTGSTILTTSPTSDVYIGSGTSTPAVLSIEGGVGSNAALLVNNLNSGDLFTASASGTTKFTIANNGNITATGSLSGLTNLSASGTVNLSGLSANSVVFTDGSKNLTSTGTVSVGQGGTGTTSLTQYGVLYGNNTSAVGVTGVGTTGQFLTSGNGTTGPSFATITSGEINNSDFLVKVPGSTAANTVTPTAANTVSLTLNGTTGIGAPDILDIANSSQVIQSSFNANGAFNTLQSITAPTATNTINGLIIGSGALSGVTGYAQGSGNFAVTGGGSVNLGTGNNTSVALGNNNSTFALTSTGLNVTTGGALTGVASIDTITTSPTQLGFQNNGTITTGNNGIFTVTPNGTGNVVFNPNAGGQAAVIINNLGQGDLLTASVSGSSVFTVGHSGSITAATSTNTINGIVIDGSQNISSVGNLTLSGYISGATATNTINGIVINGGSIAAATSGNTINGTIINAGSITAATSSTINGININSSAISGVSTLSLSGAITGATATNTINGVIINAGAITASGTSSLSLDGGTGATVDIAGTSTGNVNIAAGGGDVNLAGGSGSTGCTITNSNGNIICSGVLQTNGSSAVAYNRIGTGTTSKGLNSANDLFISGNLEVAGNVYANGTGLFGYIQRNNGALSPTNITDDLLLGGTSTASAKFAFTNNGSSGTPTASISAQTAGGPAVSLGANGTLQTYDMAPLTLGGTSTGAINLGTDATARAITIGNSQAATSLTLTAGSTGKINFFSSSNSLTSTGNLTLAGTITAATSSTLNGININSSAVSGVTNLTLSGYISGATATNTINGIVINGSQAVSGVSTLNLSGAITGATATNTINGVVINGGALSSISTLNLSGAITGATATNTINGVVINAGAITAATSSTINGININSSAISGVTNLTLSGYISGATATNTINGVIINGSQAVSNVSSLSLSGAINFTAAGAINAGGTSALSLDAGTGAAINIAGTSTGGVNIAGSGTGDVNIAGGSGSTGCTITNSNGNLACSGTITSNGTVLSQLIQENSGAIAPLHISDDLLLGATATSSARFAFTNVVGSGTPTASLSAGLTGASYFTAAGLIATTNMQPVTIGATTTGAINIGTDATARSLTIGNTTGATALNLNAGSGNINFFSTANSLTSTGNLSLAGGGSLKLSGATSGAITLNTNAAAGTYTLTLPNSAGINGQALSTNGSGGLSWINVATGTNPWDLSSNAIIPKDNQYDLLLGGNSTSSASFHVYGGVASGTNPVVKVSANTSNAGLIVSNSGNGDIFTASASATPEFIIDKSGNVGIGGRPATNLDLTGSGATILATGAAQFSSISGAGLTDCLGGGKKLQYNGATKQFECVSNASLVKPFTDQGTVALVATAGTNYWQWLGSQPASPAATLVSAADSVLIQGTVNFQGLTATNKNLSIELWGNSAGATPTCNGTGSNYRVGAVLGVLASSSGGNSVITFSLVDTPGTTTVAYTICSNASNAQTGNIARTDIQLQEITTSDLAELYPTLSSNLQPGDILTSDATLTSGVERSTTENDSKLMGVVSTKPAQIIGGADIPSGMNAAAVALSGRVPVKVSSLNGTVAVGDPITSSPLPGIGEKQVNAGKIVGRIIQAPTSFDTNSCKVVSSLDEMNSLWPVDYTGANTDKPCFAIPTQNVPNVPATYTKPYVYVTKAMMKVENAYNDPGTFNLALNKDGQIQIAKGAKVNPADLKDANNYYLTDAAGNILTNAQAFSTIESANATFGSVSADHLSAASFATNKMTIGGITLNASDSGMLALTNDQGKEVLSLDSKGNMKVGGSVSTEGANIAQNFQTTDSTMSVGDVVSLDATTPNMVDKATKDSMSQMVGVYTATSGITLNGATGSAAFAPIAISGQTDVNVSTENGAIHKGDFLTASTIPGIAMKATKPGMVIGRALKDFDGSFGEIPVLVNVIFADPSNKLGNLANEVNGTAAVTTMSTAQVTLSTPLSLNGMSVSGTLDNGLHAITNSISSTSASLNAVQVALNGIATTSAGLTNRLASLESSTASLSAQVAQSNEKAASTASGLTDLAGKVNNILSTLSGAFVATSASGSAYAPLSDVKLGLDSLTANTATVAGTLTVLGRTTLSDLGVTGHIAAGVLVVNGMGDNGLASINTLGDLQLQNNGLGGIDILSGKVHIDTNGNITTQASVTAQVVNTEKLNITTDTSSTSSAVLGASAGTATVAAGTNSLTIDTTAVTSKSLIYVTFNGDYSPAIRYWVDSKSAGKSFTVKLDVPVARSVQFNWWIVN